MAVNVKTFLRNNSAGDKAWTRGFVKSFPGPMIVGENMHKVLVGLFAEVGEELPPNVVLQQRMPTGRDASRSIYQPEHQAAKRKPRAPGDL